MMFTAENIKKLCEGVFSTKNNKKKLQETISKSAPTQSSERDVQQTIFNIQTIMQSSIHTIICL